MADRWWVNDDADNDWNNANNWAYTEGGTGGAGIPTASDDVFFSDTSDEENCAITGSPAVCKNLYMASADTGGTDDWTGTLFLSDQGLSVAEEYKDSTTATTDNGSSTLTVSGSTFTIGGSFTKGTGTVKFTYGGSVAVDVGSETFNDVELDDVSLELNITGTMDVDGTLTLTEFESIGSGTLACSGDVITLATGAANAAGTLKFDGTSQELYTDKGGTQGKLSCIIEFAHSGTVTVYDDILHRGSLVYTSGTVDFTTNNSVWTCRALQAWEMDLSAGDLTFYDVVFNATNLDVKTNAFIVSNTFTMTNSAGIDSVSGGTIELQGNVVLNDPSVGGDCPISFTGGNAQAVSGSGMKLPDGTVTVNKSGGTLTLGAALNLDGVGQDFVMQAGSFDCATFNFTVNDDITQNGGVWTAGSGTISGGGDFNIAAGTFTPESSTVELTAASSVTLSGSSFFNFTINSSGTVTIQDTYAVDGTLEITTGTLDLNGQDGSIENITTTAGTFDMGSGTASISGDADLSNLDTLSAASAILQINGSSTQTLDLGGGSFLTITVTNPSPASVIFSTGFTVGTFICITAGAALKFGSGETFTVNTLFRVYGTSLSNVSMTSTSGGASFDIDVVASNREVGYVTLQDAHQIDGTDVPVSFGTDVSNNIGWVFVNAYIWDGGGGDNLASTDANWVGDSAPPAASAARFDATDTKDCTWDLSNTQTNIDIVSGYTGTITITQNIDLTANFTQSDGTVVVQNSKSFDVDGSLTLGASATFTCGTGDTFEVGEDVAIDSGATVTLNDASFDLNGAISQDIDFGGNTVTTLTVSNNTAAVTFSASLTATNWTINPNASVKFLAGGTFTSTDITWDGTAGNTILFRSTIDGTAWNLVVGEATPTADYADVKDSDASGGSEIDALTGGIDRGGNTNWKFPPTGGGGESDGVGRTLNRNINRMATRMRERTG